MISIFKRIFTIGSAEAHSAIDKLENPIKLTDEGIRRMKEDLNKALQGLAEVKAIAIRTRKELEQNRALAEDYEQKAILLLKRAQEGAISQSEADRLAAEALNKKEQALQLAAVNEKNLALHEQAVAKMEANVQRLKTQISDWENEAKILKARARVSEASAKLNKHLANIDPNGTVAMLEKMREKVYQQEALAESYAQIADSTKSVDEEIEKALGGGTRNASASSALEALKAKLALESSKKNNSDPEPPQLPSNL
ncbi:MAG: PspA/IM30 family protein [Cytophagales bacterium]|nr:PspA/IM30 family protein [Cytophagales bacterium]MDW8383480.1 PspA/IM30 family protein [Flammeovirgaceae bacterium]